MRRYIISKIFFICFIIFGVILILSGLTMWFNYNIYLIKIEAEKLTPNHLEKLVRISIISAGFFSLGFFSFAVGQMGLVLISIARITNSILKEILQIKAGNYLSETEIRRCAET